VKDGIDGEDWLFTIHGYLNNGDVCEDVIKPYNDDPSTMAVPGKLRCKPIEK
jgi:hypothetical protein